MDRRDGIRCGGMRSCGAKFSPPPSPHTDKPLQTYLSFGRALCSHFSSVFWSDFWSASSSALRCSASFWLFFSSDARGGEQTPEYAQGLFGKRPSPPELLRGLSVCGAGNATSENPGRKARVGGAYFERCRYKAQSLRSPQGAGHCITVFPVAREAPLSVKTAGIWQIRLKTLF